jgi:threonine dehydratase
VSDREAPWDHETGPVDPIDVEGSARLIRPQVRPTTLLASEALDAALGSEVRIASETFQHTGSFKYRAALSVALASNASHLLAASSGNFGAALALAAKRTGKRCTIVMPAQSARVKIDAVRSHGATVDLVDTSKTSRLDRVEQLRSELADAQVISAYDDFLVIAGNATLGVEVLEAGVPDCVVVPVGGGGLSSGIVKARDHLRAVTEVIGAEPALANDAARSLRAGVICRDEHESATLCDGARTLALGQRNFSILRRGLGGIVEVPEDAVIRALQLLYLHCNLKVEPTGALAVAAVLAEPARFAQKRVTCIVSGGNVDPALYARLLTQ